MCDHFDMAKIIGIPENTNKTKALPRSPWADDIKPRDTFAFTLGYFTIVGGECVPMAWQKADEELRDARACQQVQFHDSFVSEGKGCNQDQTQR